MSKEKFIELLGVVDLSIDPYEVAAFMPENHTFDKDKWRMKFLMKSGKEIHCSYMGELCFRSWKGKLQLLFDYIHPGKMEEWKIENGFTGYLDIEGISNSRIKEAEKKISIAGNKKISMKDLFNRK